MPEACKLYITAGRAGEPAEAEGASNSVVRDDESDPQHTIDTIVSRQPDVIALDHEFAASPRGLALIERLIDGELVAGAEIIVALADGTHYRYGGGGPAKPLRFREEALRPPSTDGKTRRAPRVGVRDGVSVLVDGREATLVDLSVVGAQILSSFAPHPGRAVRLGLLEEAGDSTATVKVSGRFVWSRLEPPAKGAGGVRYRAGVSFTDPDPVAILRYCGRHRGSLESTAPAGTTSSATG